MAKGAYLGIGDTARKVKNIYVGAGVNTYQKTVTATEFQQGALLYSSGTLDTSFTNYVSTTNFYEASYGNVVKIISSKVTPLEDSGFLWYDSNYNFISGNKGTVSGKFVSGEPPVNTAYFKFNLNSSGVTPSTASGTGIAVYSVARKIKKAYIGDENGLARLCWSRSEVPFVSGIITCSSSSKIEVNNIGFTPTHALLIINHPGISNYSNDLYGGTFGKYYLGTDARSSSSSATINGESVTFNGSFTRNKIYSYYLWREGQ